MSREQKERLKERIERLEDHEQLQVFYIVRKYTKDFTKTETGIFVSLDTTPKECLAEIEVYIRFCGDQKKSNDEHMKLRKKYEEIVNL